MYATAETEIRIGVHAERRPGFANIDEIPRRRFEQHIRRLVFDLAVEAAHDAAQAEIAQWISDQNALRQQLVYLTVQRRQRLPIVG